MYAVIFRAEIKLFDDRYSKMAIKMRNLAINKYGCTEFIAVTEGSHEVAISYWNNQKDIQEWKKNAEHLVAQKLGKAMWYKSYKVQIVEVKHEYGSSI
jgi:hypothetical protein